MLRPVPPALSRLRPLVLGLMIFTLLWSTGVRRCEASAATGRAFERSKATELLVVAPEATPKFAPERPATLHPDPVDDPAADPAVHCRHAVVAIRRAATVASCRPPLVGTVELRL